MKHGDRESFRAIEEVDRTARDESWYNSGIWPWFDRQAAHKRGQLYWLVVTKDIVKADDLRTVLAGSNKLAAKTKAALLERVNHLLSQWTEAPEPLKQCVKKLEELNSGSTLQQLKHKLKRDPCKVS